MGALLRYDYWCLNCGEEFEDTKMKDGRCPVCDTVGQRRYSSLPQFRPTATKHIGKKRKGERYE